MPTGRGWGKEHPPVVFLSVSPPLCQDHFLQYLSSLEIAVDHINVKCGFLAKWPHRGISKQSHLVSCHKRHPPPRHNGRHPFRVSMVKTSYFTDCPRNLKAGRQTDRQADIQIDRQVDRQADRQTKETKGYLHTFAVGLHSGGCVDGVAKETVAGHLDPDNTRNHWPCVNQPMFTQCFICS